MNRRGFLGSLAALVAAVKLKVKTGPTDHLAATYGGTFTPDAGNVARHMAGYDPAKLDEEFDIIVTRLNPWVWTEEDYKSFAEFHKLSYKNIDTE